MKNYRHRIAWCFSGLLITLQALPGAAFAHHSVSGFDPDATATISGVVTDFDWSNPHVTIELAPGDSPGMRVRFEGMSPDFLGRRSWNRYSLRPGDTVDIEYFPKRDGSPGGLVIRAFLPDGTIRIMIDTD